MASSISSAFLSPSSIDCIMAGISVVPRWAAVSYTHLPYGITDFSRIQKENYYYVDKTMFIEKIEMQPPYLFLIRPRRFGKSLTLAMLEAYYDVNHACLLYTSPFRAVKFVII